MIDCGAPLKSILKESKWKSKADRLLSLTDRIDLKVKNDKEEIIIIEVQYEREFDYLQRILFGASKVITEHINKKVPYSEVVKVISINILYFDPGHGNDYIYHGTTTFKGLHSQDLLQLSEEQQELYEKNKIHEIFPEYYLIKVNNFDDIAKDTLDEWIYFLKNEEIKEDFTAKGIKKAKVELDILKLAEEERQAYEQYQDDLHYQASMVESSYTVGGKKREKEIAIKLLISGNLDIEAISEATELSVEKLQELKQKHTPKK